MDKGLFVVREGEVVRYVHKVDADPAESPNVSPAIVVKRKNGRALNLFVLTSNGHFNVLDVPHGSPQERGSWHRLQIGE